MECCLLDLAKNEVQSLVNLVKNEAQYLCCFNSNVENFDRKKEILVAKHKDVKRKFQKGKGVFSFKFEARQWEHEADDIFDIDTKIKKKLFCGRCPNCWWQYRRGKELAEKTQHIEKLLERCNSNIIAGRANLSDIKSLSSQDFIHFESRESTFQDLLKALQDDNCNMIGLQGMGGAGKTSMAKEVGLKLKESKYIDKFIFLVVSQAPDFKKIRGELAKSLDLNLDEVKEEEHSSTIVSRITNMDEKLLILLDDVWVKFDVREKLGIPFCQQRNGGNLLITTRNSHVCTEMGCQMIQLQVLTNEEALNLFEAHVSLNNSPRGLKGMPQKIVKHCGGVPVAIVAVARALNKQLLPVWKDALKTLEDRSVDQNLEEAYKCLKLSYDNLKNEMAKELLLISSLFPEDFEIPIKLLMKIGIGLSSFNENDKYHLTRSDVDAAIMELMHSSLLLNGEEESVKMHDLVREVALWIGENDIQSLMELKRPIKRNLRYLFWKNDDFLDEFSGIKLEFLSIVLDYSKDLNVSETFFVEKTSLKVLIVCNYDKRIPALSLTNSLQPLKDIRALILGTLELGNISVLGNLMSLRNLWFLNCSIIELPKEFLKLKKLQSLEVERCKIEKNNPFEVIEMCSQLEELTFVSNVCNDKEKDAISGKGSPLTLHRYFISCEDDLSSYFEKYGSMSRCFQTDELSHLLSEATFKQLVRGAELLFLNGENEKRIWKNLIPNLVAIDEGGVMNDLIVLHLISHLDMQCLIDTKHHDPGVSAFCNLAELHLSKMGVEDLCWGPPPSGFLEQLETMKLTKCHKLKSILSNANYNLCHLKYMELEDCPMLKTVFLPSTARSLMQLEELTIRSCNALEYIIVVENGESIQKSCYDSLFPKLKIFGIEECNKLRMILSILFAGDIASLEKISICGCEQLEFIFDTFQEGKDVMLPLLKELELSRVPSFVGIFREYHQPMSSLMQKLSPPLSRHNSNNINQNSAARAFSWIQACCSLNNWKPASIATNIVVSEHRVPDHANPPGLFSSKKWIDTALTLVGQLLPVRHIKKMELAYLSLNNLVSALFTMSMASMVSWEELTIRDYDGLKHLATSEGDDYRDEINCYSIFPKLHKLEIWQCMDLEFLFLSTISVEIKNLKSLIIKNAPKLTYVFGKSQHHHNMSNQIQNDELHFDLPTLEALCLEDVPEFIGIGVMNCKMVSPSLQNVFSDEGQLNSNTTKEVHASPNGTSPFHAAQNLLIQSLKNVRKWELTECANLVSLSILSIASIVLLEDLTIEACDHLKCIVADEGDDGAHMKYNSIFPKLKQLQVSDCGALEYLFPAYAFRCPVYLESLKIYNTPMLKYVFGRSQYEDNLTHENQNIQTHIDFPALKELSIMNVPELVSICPENYYLRWLSLLSVSLGGLLQEFTMRSFNELLVCWQTKQEETKVCQQTLKSLEVEYSKTKVIFDLTFYMNREKNGDGLELLTSSLQELKFIYLSELVNLCVGPKRIIRFNSLQYLTIIACKKLRVIFSASTVRSLPMLKVLNISKCEELVHIVEDDYATNGNELCFPNLERVFVENCDKLKYLFSVTISDMLPKLWYLDIRESCVLEHVLIRRDEIKEMVMKDVLPQLRCLDLKELPNLVNVCDGIDFQILKENSDAEVVDCPNFSFYETSITQSQVGLETANSQVEEEAEDKLSSHLSTDQSLNMGEETQQSLTKEIQGETEEVEEDFMSEIAKTTISSSDSKFTGQLDELVSKEEKNEAIMMDPSAIGTENLKMKGPIHTSPNLTVLPTRGHTYANAKIFEEEEEEEGSLITSRRPRSGIKDGGFLPKEKLGTSIDGDPFVPLGTTILSEQTFEAMLPLSPVPSKASTNLNQTPSSIIPMPSDDDVQVCDKSNVESSNLIQREQESTYSKDSQLLRRAMPTTPFVTISQDESSKIVEVRTEEGASILETPHPSCLTSKKKPIPVSPNPIVLPRSPSTTTKCFEEEEKGGLVTTHGHGSDMKAMGSLLVGKEHKTSNHGRSVKENDGTTSKPLHETLDAIQISSQLAECSSPDMTPSIYDTNNAFSVAGVKEILDMMKLEGVEPSLLAQAFKINPQLCLSSEDRSTELLCYSYKVLLNILNILATRNAFTINEADKRSLAKYLKDASVLGFDKGWLESIRIKVFNCDALELHHKQQVLKSLGNKLEANKRKLVNVCDQEAKTARLVEMAQKELEATHKELEAAYKGLEAAQYHFNVAQQEHANIRICHSQLLEEFQEILEQRDQCSEIIAAKLGPFGF